MNSVSSLNNCSLPWNCSWDNMASSTGGGPSGPGEGGVRIRVGASSVGMSGRGLGCIGKVAALIGIGCGCMTGAGGGVY